MICGALQTLNEEACEDVLEETEDTKITIEPDVPQTSIIPPSPESNQGESQNVLIPLYSNPMATFNSIETLNKPNNDSDISKSNLNLLASPNVSRRNVERGKHNLHLLIPNKSSLNLQSNSSSNVRDKGNVSFRKST